MADARSTFTYYLKAVTGDLERGFKKSSSSSTTLTRDLAKLEKQSLDVREATLKAQAAQTRAARATERYGKESLQAAQAQVRLERAQEKANIAARTGGRHFDSLGRSMKSAVKATAGFAGLYGVAAGVSSIGRATVDFDRGMRNVNSIAQLSEKRLAVLSRRVVALGGRTAQAPKTLAEGLYDLVSSGFNANQSMRILASSAKAASAGLTTTEISTKAVAAVLNAYRMPASRAAKVSDQLFQTVNLGVISFEQLASTIGDVLPFASSLGVGLDQLGGSISTMTKAGISPEETMTRIKNVMVAMLKPGKTLTKALDDLGYSSGEAMIRQRGFQGALEELVKHAGGSKTAVAALFPNIRALGGVLALTGKNAAGAGKDLLGFKDVAGATDKALAQQSQSFSYQWQKFQATLDGVKITLGTALLPTMRKGVTTLGLFVEQVMNGTGAGGRFLDTVKEIVAPTNQVAGALVGFAKSNPELAKAAASFAIIGGAAAKISRLTGLGGVLKLGFARGNTPLTPMYVQQVGVGGGGKPTPVGKLPPAVAVGGPAVATGVATAGNQSRAFKGGPTIGTGLPAGDKAGFGLTAYLRKQLGEIIGFRSKVRHEMDRYGAMLAVLTRQHWGLVNTSTRQKLRDINGTVRVNMRRVRGAMERDSRAGALALRENVSGAITALQSSMHTGTVSVETGMRRINELLRVELKELGVNYLSATGKSPAIKAGEIPKPKAPKGGSKYVLAPPGEEGGAQIGGPVREGTRPVRRSSGGGTFAARGPAAQLRDWLSRKGFATTSEGRSSSDTYHGMGLALDYGTSRNDLSRLARVLWPARRQFEELFIPTWAPHGGLYHNGSKFTSPALQADHQDHIHVAETGSFRVPEVKIPRVRMARGLGAVTAIGQAALDKVRRAAIRFGNRRLEQGGAPVGAAALRALWEEAGGPASRSAMAAAVALAESGGNPRAVNRNRDGSVDRGLWQINSVHGALSTFNQLGNARAAVRISKRGTYWKPWTVFRNGKWRRFLADAQRAKVNAPAARRKVMQSGVTGARKAGFGHTQPQTWNGFPVDTGYTPAAKSFLRIPETSTAGGYELAGGTGAALAQNIPMVAEPAGMSQADRDQLLKDILAQLALQNKRAEVIATTEGGVIAQAITSVVTGQIGGKAFLSMQTPGSTGQLARY